MCNGSHNRAASGDAARRGDKRARDDGADVLIRKRSCMVPTGELHVALIFPRGNHALSLLTQSRSCGARTRHIANCSKPLRKRHGLVSARHAGAQASPHGQKGERRNPHGTTCISTRSDSESSTPQTDSCALPRKSQPPPLSRPPRPHTRHTTRIRPVVRPAVAGRKRCWTAEERRTRCAPRALPICCVNSEWASQPPRSWRRPA